ncbi:hypothetical protein SAMN05421874_101676 [Nonomuraea maritima]|uniref:Uncharacterized protein n=1 Tax=Nonomuraea maritima TaxID=683260 RepID=A0A1G8TDA9_9ACTN|nr:hypothetical protein [Nonomuraea maritima]SDJ39556.1 hypothetical protein SAMN05421874_101676 [Nonomuraea maritima]
MNETRPGDGVAAPPDDDRFHAVHVPGGPAYTELDWEPVRSGGAARVRSYTCDCRPTFYELCYGNGQAFIRRTRRTDGQTLVDECARGRPAKTMVVWFMLLSGEAT